MVKVVSELQMREEFSVCWVRPLQRQCIAIRCRTQKDNNREVIINLGGTTKTRLIRPLEYLFQGTFFIPLTERSKLI